MERDDIIEYSLDAHHSEEQGQRIRRKIWLVTLFLAVVTAVEVGLGAYWRSFLSEDKWQMVKWSFIVLTLVKATYIVMTFMHLGDERRNIRSIILLPYGLFIIYLIFIALWESNYINRMLDMFQ
ncbi:MAG: cytochrome C oxidase subunit IV family protein [Flavobacteriales bacterium]|nr:cytochrome C oxidase subunit IV family protein [Flavobacteriales bacterium]